VTDYPATFPLDEAAFLAGLDSPNHSPESRRAWVRLFFRDMKAARTPGPWRERLRAVLDDNCATSTANQGLHSWSCEYPDLREGPCRCVDLLLDDLVNLAPAPDTRLREAAQNLVDDAANASLSEERRRRYVDEGVVTLRAALADLDATREETK